MLSEEIIENEILEDGSQSIDQDIAQNVYEALMLISSKKGGWEVNQKFVINDSMKDKIRMIQEVLPINDVQVVLFSVIAAFTIGNDGSSRKDIGRALDINPYILFNMEKDIYDMLDKKLIFLSRRDFMENEYTYSANLKILESIRDGEKVKMPEKDKVETNIDLVCHLASIIKNKSVEGDIIDVESERICRNNKALDFTDRMNAKNLNLLEKCIIISLLNNLITKECDVDFKEMCTILEKQQISIVVLKSYMCGNANILIKNNYVEVRKNEFAQNSFLHITANAISTFLPKEKKNILVKNNKHDTNEYSWTDIKPKNITAKTLIYDNNTRKQVNMLHDILSDNGLKTLKKNLKEHGLHSGINVLLYGYPGMGKTETVLQLCKETQRKVLQVNISDMKSAWFGESEKIVESLFNEYERMIKNSRRMPVLLFNEADGILSKRRELSGSNNCGQTENAMQNILLQHFECNDGIIICTTNMTNNLDNAFSRRFLYKIEFNKPDIDTKAKLVKLKLGKYLNDEECQQIANTYSLTGGTLDNTLTKIVAKQCLYGTIASYNEICEFLEQEIIGGKRSAIGFGSNASN
jgi:AAA+ superfamily predicted ATPase